MKLAVKDIQGQAQGELEVKIALVENGRGSEAVHQTIVSYNAAQRMGTACTKNAGDVAGTNKKPWRQKGTGRARAGSFQSPLWRGGGVVFGPKPRDFSTKVNRATKQLALLKALSERIKSGDVLIVSELKLASPKTRDFLSVLAALQVEGTALIVDHAGDTNLRLASRNVSRVELATGDSLNTYQVLRSGKLVFTRGAFEQVEKRLAKD
ncbi:MAG TPA: 50S ribosomal protein L4 [Verrucomicrobiae bacterium]|jgi:large subunit ribosomal protein L4